MKFIGPKVKLRSPGAFVHEPVGRDPLGSTKKRVTYTAKRSIVIQTDGYAFKSRNSSLTRPFCSNRLLFGDGGDDGRCGIVEFFSCGVMELFSSSIMHHARGRMHTISCHGQIVQTSLDI